jgi:hypothetical protein
VYDVELALDSHVLGDHDESTGRVIVRKEVAGIAGVDRDRLTALRPANVR